MAAGTPEGVDALAERARAAGVRKVMPLAVGHAFHTPLLADAADELGPTLASTTVPGHRRAGRDQHRRHGRR